MALEDRCSPQSASPPHRIPNTPSQEQKSNSTDKEMAHMVSPIDPTKIKAEEEDTMSSTDDQQQTPPPVSFSISNILSDTFGKVLPHRQHSLFRPYESKEQHLNSQVKQTPAIIPGYPLMPSVDHHSAFLQNRLEEIYNYRKMVDSLGSLGSLNHLNSLSSLGSFSAYPRIHEEILNSHRKFSQKLDEGRHLHERQQQSHQTQSPMHTKPPQTTPPLGNLCKTVSQIGRPQITATPASISPKSDRSSLISPPNAQKSADIDSSDDTRSESSMIKDDNGQMWPAWVFCTRYSDRPSSGEYRRLIFENLFFLKIFVQ